MHRRSGQSVRRPRLLLAVVAMAAGAAGILLSGLGAASAASTHVDLLPTTGVVDNVMASYIDEGIAHAQADGAEAVVIELNTPGGSLSSTTDIVSSILEAPVPVIVWVAPAGKSRRKRRHLHHARGAHRADGSGNEHRRGLAGGQQRPGHPGHARREGEERRDREHQLDRRGARSQRRLGGQHRRPGQVLFGQRGRQRRGGRRDRRHDRGCPGIRERAAGHGGRGPAGHAGDGRRGRQRARDEPGAVVPPSAGRPEHRVHPVHAGVLRPAVRAHPPELRDGHPRRACC